MQRITGFFSARAWLGVIAAVVLLMNGNQAQAADVMGQITASQPKVFKICKNQTYALCAVASCFVFNKLSYCACDVMRGDSISLPLSFGDNQDACTVNAEGATNGFMVSTFSVPESVVKPQDKQAPPPAGAQALYNCPSGNSPGAYAQCDGGICFTSTEGQTFPGIDKPLTKGQVICSCPITQAKANAKVGFQIAGPYPCQNDFFKNCGSHSANSKNGSTIYVGAPTGSALFLAQRLTGNVLGPNDVYQCSPPAKGAGGG